MTAGLAAEATGGSQILIGDLAGQRNLRDDLASLRRAEGVRAHQSADDVVRAPYRMEERRLEALERLRHIQVELLNNLVKRGNVKGPVLADVLLERLRSIAEHVEDKGLTAPAKADRKEMMSATEDLISDVKDWSIPDHAREALLLKLNAIQRIIQASTTFSDAEIRAQVAKVVADFAADFAKVDEQHQTKLERLAMWAKRVFFAGASLLALPQMPQESWVFCLLH